MDGPIARSCHVGEVSGWRCPHGRFMKTLWASAATQTSVSSRSPLSDLHLRQLLADPVFLRTPTGK